MDLHTYLRILRKRWKLIMSCALIALAAAAAVTFETKPTYQSQAELYVSIQGNVALSELYQGQLLAQSGVQSYVDVVTSPKVLNPVIHSLGLALSPAALSTEVSASSPANTVLIDVSVNNGNPAAAERIANAVAQQFAIVIEQLNTPKSGRASPVKATVVKPASVPAGPVSPRKKLNLGLGLLAGLVVGVGGAVARESLDRSVKSPGELQELTGAPLIGVTGHDPDIPKHPLPVITRRNSPTSESIRQLRTNLQFVNVDGTSNSIVFTSSVPIEGKSTIVTNLAVAIAQAGKSCLLVEADLRRPKVTSYLGLDSSVGLTTVVTGQVDLKDAIQEWGTDSLSVLPSGPLPPNPSELLASRNMRELLAAAESTFEFVLLDAPPLLPVTDAAVLAGAVSGAVLVVRAGQTHREEVRRSVEALRTVDSRLLGTVLSMVRAKGGEAYQYGYGYYSYSKEVRSTGGPTGGSNGKVKAKDLLRQSADAAHS